MDLPDRKCVELDEHQAITVGGFSTFCTRVFRPSNAWNVTHVERIVIHHDPAGHMVRVKQAAGWSEYVNQPYTVVPSSLYEEKEQTRGALTRMEPVCLTVDETKGYAGLGKGQGWSTLTGAKPATTEGYGLDLGRVLAGGGHPTEGTIAYSVVADTGPTTFRSFEGERLTRAEWEALIKTRP